MLIVRYTNLFKKDYKLMKKRGMKLEKLKYVVNELANQHPLDEKYRDHELMGNYRSFRECHIEPDWLLIYRIEKDELTLVLVRTGIHSDLF